MAKKRKEFDELEGVDAGEFVRKLLNDAKPEVPPPPDERIVFSNIEGQPAISVKDAKLLTRGLTNPNKIAFILALAQLGNQARACASVGISRIIVWTWRKEDSDFKRAYEQALDIAADLMEDELYRRACEGVLKPVFQQGRLIGSVREFSDTLLIFGLKGARPEKYAERQKVEVTDMSARLRAARERALGRKR